MAGAGRVGRSLYRVTGEVQLSKALLRMGASSADLTAVHTLVARRVATKAKALAPRQTGTLAGTITPIASKHSGRVVAGRGIKYAGPIHFGWPAHNIEAQPFLFDALAESKDDVIKKYGEYFDVLVRRVGRAK